MRSNNLFFYNGEGTLQNQQIVLNSERTVAVVDGENEFLVQNVKKIDIKSDHGKIKINLNPQVAFISGNKKIVINESNDRICIEMLNTEEQVAKYVGFVNAQEARGLIDYIREYAPNLHSMESLQGKTLDELKKLKESMDDLANCY